MKHKELKEMFILLMNDSFKAAKKVKAAKVKKKPYSPSHHITTLDKNKFYFSKKPTRESSKGYIFDVMFQFGSTPKKRWEEIPFIITNDMHLGLYDVINDTIYGPTKEITDKFYGSYQLFNTIAGLVDRYISGNVSTHSKAASQTVEYDLYVDAIDLIPETEIDGESTTNNGKAEGASKYAQVPLNIIKKSSVEGETKTDPKYSDAPLMAQIPQAGSKTRGGTKCYQDAPYWQGKELARSVQTTRTGRYTEAPYWQDKKSSRRAHTSAGGRYMEAAYWKDNQTINSVRLKKDARYAEYPYWQDEKGKPSTRPPAQAKSDTIPYCYAEDMIGDKDRHSSSKYNDIPFWKNKEPGKTTFPMLDNRHQHTKQSRDDVYAEFTVDVDYFSGDLQAESALLHKSRLRV